MANVPVLDRRNTVEEDKEYGYKSAVMANEDDIARIKRNYAMLINPETKLDELLGRKSEETAVASDSVRRSEKQIYRVENARADSALFRADSEINKRLNRMSATDNSVDSEEEENEDLRPTPTTIQYRTAGVKNTTEVGKIQNAGVKKASILNKKEKIIIAIAVSVIIALFALVIINSAIISRLNSDINAVENSYDALRSTYSQIQENINSVTSELENRVIEYATSNGMVK